MRVNYTSDRLYVIKDLSGAMWGGFQKGLPTFFINKLEAYLQAELLSIMNKDLGYQVDEVKLFENRHFIQIFECNPAVQVGCGFWAGVRLIGDGFIMATVYKDTEESKFPKLHCMPFQAPKMYTTGYDVEYYLSLCGDNLSYKEMLTKLYYINRQQNDELIKHTSNFVKLLDINRSYLKYNVRPFPLLHF